MDTQTNNNMEEEYTQEQLDQMEYELWIMKARAFFETEQTEEYGNN